MVYHQWTRDWPLPATIHFQFQFHRVLFRFDSHSTRPSCQFEPCHFDCVRFGLSSEIIDFLRVHYFRLRMCDVRYGGR